MGTIEIKKYGNGSYMITLDGAMVSFVSREDLIRICEELQRETGDYTYE